MHNKKGFTVIEIIIVIAIIAILSAIILSNVASYVKKSRDAAIKSTMNQIRAEANKFYLADPNSQTFFAFCEQGSPCYNMTQEILENNGQQSIPSGGLSYFGSVNHFCMVSYLNEKVDGTNLFWCVDDSGFAGIVADFNYCGNNGTCE